MKLINPRFSAASFCLAAFSLLLVLIPRGLRAQEASRLTNTTDIEPLSSGPFRTQRTPVEGGAEIITIFIHKDGPDGDLPLISVLKDTLGDHRVENDRLRYVWLHSYARPSLSQELSSAVPFLYMRTSNKTTAGSGPPPPIVDLNRPGGSSGWDTLLWHLFKRVALADSGYVVKPPAGQYLQNKSEYRRT